MSDHHHPAVCCRDHAATAVLSLIRENGDAIVVAERARIVAEVKALPTLVLPTGTYVDVEDVFDAVTEP